VRQSFFLGGGGGVGVWNSVFTAGCCGLSFINFFLVFSWSSCISLSGSLSRTPLLATSAILANSLILLHKNITSQRFPTFFRKACKAYQNQTALPSFWESMWPRRCRSYRASRNSRWVIFWRWQPKNYRGSYSHKERGGTQCSIFCRRWA